MIITGIHHADGLADFADGLMVKGSKDKKLNAIKYPINNNGYILPKFNGLSWAGSIYSNDEILDTDIIDIHANPLIIALAQRYAVMTVVLPQ